MHRLIQWGIWISLIQKAKSVLVDAHKLDSKDHNTGYRTTAHKRVTTLGDNNSMAVGSATGIALGPPNKTSSVNHTHESDANKSGQHDASVGKFVSLKAKGFNCIYKLLVDRPFCLEADELYGLEGMIKFCTDRVM